MGQESSKSNTKLSGRNQSAGGSRRHTSPLSSMNEGTSVDGSISSQVGEFKSHDSQTFQSEQSEMDGQLQNTVVGKYLSLKGEIDEVKSLNAEVMEKISLLEKKSEEKKKQRALNRMQTARFKEKVSNGYVQTGQDIKNKKSEETLSAETKCAGMTVVPLSAEIESSWIAYNHTEAPNTIVALEDKSEDVSSVNPRLKDTYSDCVVAAELNNDVNKVANEEVKDALVDTLKVDLSARGKVAAKDAQSATTYFEAENGFENAGTGKDRPITITKVVAGHQLINKRHSPTNSNTKSEDDMKTETCFNKLKETETVEIIAENCQPMRDSKSGSERVSMESVDENELNVDSEESEKILDKEKTNENSMKGFADTFELTVPQREYNLMLKRTKTNEKQDNRLAFEFNLQPNVGCLYTSMGPLENQTESATCLSASVKLLSHEEDRDRSSEMKQHEGKQENASKLSKDKKPIPVGRTVKSSVWKTTPAQKDKIHDAIRKPKGTDTETKSAAVGADSDNSYGLKTNIQTVQKQSVADQVPKKTKTLDERSKIKVTEGVVDNTEVVGQKQNFPGPRTTSSDLPAALTPLTAQLIKQSASQLEKMGIPLKIDRGKITVGEVEWKFDERLGKLKAVNADELKEAIREAQSELKESEGDMGEEEWKQFKFCMCMLELTSSMCSDEGVDIIESLKAVGSLGSMENVDFAAIFGEESAGHMQTLLKASSQIVKVIEPHLPATGAAASASAQSAAVKPAENLPSTPSQQSEVKVKAVTESEAVKVTEAAKSASTEDKTVPSGHQSDEEEQEVILVDEAQWIDAANIELEQGRRCRDIREAGMDTIICLDVSSSMRGEAWNQALGFIRGFIDCIQGTTLSDGCFEHVALVTFGSETKVQQHMTCDYVEVLRKLEHLKPGGPSPMLAGVLMVLAAIRGAGSVFQAGGYKIYPRVFLITDGKATPGGMISGPDRCSADELDIVFSPILGYVHTIYQEHHCTVNPVPVGSFDLTLLQRLAEDTNGKITSPEDWKRVSRTMKNLVQAAKMGSGRDLLGAHSFIPLLLDDERTAEDHVEIAEFLKSHRRNESSDDEDPANTSLPPLGTRVRRTGTENVKSSDDAYNLGTVIKRFKDGYLGVTWDKTRPGVGEHERIPFSSGGGNIIKITDDFRILRDELIAVGCMVKRGKDWHYGNQDGGDGNLGAVYDVTSRGIVKVRWRSGSKNTYRFGCEGKFDLEVVSPTEPGHGNVLSDHAIEGAMGWAYRSQRESMSDDDEIMASDRLARFWGKSVLDSDEDKDSESLDSSEDSDMTLEEKMNKRNKQMSKRAYIIEPSTSENKLSHSESEKSVENTSSGDIDNAEVDIIDTSRHQQLSNSERHANMPPDSFSSASQNAKKSSDNLKTTGLMEFAASKDETALCRNSPDKLQNDFGQYGAKPKQFVLQTGNMEMSPTAGNNSAKALSIECEAETQVSEVNPVEVFAPDNDSRKKATSKADKIFDHSQQENIGKRIGKGLCGNNSEKQEFTSEKLKLQFPSNTWSQQTTDSNKTSDHLISSKMDKVCVDEVIRQTSTTTTWCWKDSDEWRPYPSTICDKIEKSFKLKKPSALIQMNGKAYRVVFSRMEQVDINSKMAIKVQRQ